MQPVVHPVVRTHPETGRKALFVSEHFTTRIVGLPEDESRALLAELFAHSVAAASFVYRHRWQPHDMVFWDNRSVMHLAAGCPTDQRRTLYRTTIEGDVPVLTLPHDRPCSHPARLALRSPLLPGRRRRRRRPKARIRIAEQFGIVYLLLNVAQDQKLIEKHGKAAGPRHQGRVRSSCRAAPPSTTRCCPARSTSPAPASARC